MRVECCTYVDGNNSLTQDFVGLVVHVGHRGCHSHDGGAVLIEFEGNGAPT
jgi:hypothetical protein